MQKLIVEFLREPNRESFMALRAHVLASEAYDPYSSELAAAERFSAAGKHEKAIAAIRETLPNLVLSPLAHLICARAHEALGDETGRQVEGHFARACVESILATGEGTAEEPYLVLRTSDEYDVLSFLEKELARQALAEEDGCQMDVMTCTDGSVYHFDITEMFSRMETSFKFKRDNSEKG